MLGFEKKMPRKGEPQGTEELGAKARIRTSVFFT